jgi:zinc finger HIT domain-containing protein 1
MHMRVSGCAMCLTLALISGRSTARHLQELERDNYSQVKIDVPTTSSMLIGRENAKVIVGKQKHSTNVKRVLQSKKNFAIILEESPNSQEYLKAATSIGSYPKREFCSICGYFGLYTCQKCSSRYCSIACRDTHQETRCMRFG